MINAASTLYQFFSSFGIPAYESHSVPDDAELPYITYVLNDGNWTSAVSIIATVWYKDTSLRGLSEKVDEIKKAVGEGLSFSIPEGGAIYLYRDTPFAQMQNTGKDGVVAAYLLFEMQTICN